MLIVANEGVFNLDNVTSITITDLMSTDGEHIWSLRITFTKNTTVYVGEWEDIEDAKKALDEIIKAHHMGLKEVFLND